jgi:glycine/D-amino acid oxidase-like deaminating enzyme
MDYIAAHHPVPAGHELAGNAPLAAPTYWLRSVAGQLFEPPERLPPSAEVVVIGGGLMGVAMAYWLARLGADVLLVEARHLAWGATGRNAGMFLSGLRPIEAADLVRSLLQDEYIEAGYQRVGHLALAASQGTFDQFQAEVAHRPDTAPPVHVVDRSACEDLLGMRIAAGFAGGRWMPDGHVIHPARLVYGLARAALRRGASFAVKTRATGVRPTGGRQAFSVDTTRGRVRTGQVVYACNIAVTEFHAPFGRFIRPVRGQVMATAPMPPVFQVALAVGYGDVYWRQCDDGVIVIGGCRSSAQGTEEDTRQEGLNPRVQHALGTFLPRAFPGFPLFVIDHRWAGVMDCTADGLPVVGALPHTEGQWVIGGFAGHGLPAGLGAGQALAESIITGRPSSLLAPFDPGRLLINDRDKDDSQ